MDLPIQAVPYLRLIKRLFLGYSSISDIADHEILCPQENVTCRPAIFLPGQIDRVKDYKATDTWAVTSKEIEVAAAISTKITHLPTVAYHIKNAVLVDGSIYVGKVRHSIADKSLFTAVPPRKLHHAKICALASTYLGTKYFGHWLTDDCTRYQLAAELAPPLCVRGSFFIHRPKYEDCFAQDWAPIDRARIDHLIAFQDVSQNSLKQKRYKLLRNKVKAYFPGRRRQAYIYLRRGQTGASRTIQNEEEIMGALSKYGFEVIDVASSSVDHIIETLLSAKIVVSMEGSHITHCTFTSPENSALLVLQPPDRFSATHRGWCESLGVRFGFVVGAFGNSGYYFSPAEILRTVDLLLDRPDV